jgi:SH3-like domain-containing protein
VKIVKNLLKTGAAAFVLLSLLLGFAAVTGADAAFATSAAGIVTTSYGSLNVRRSAGAGGEIVSRLGSGSYVTLISKTGNWWYVEYAAGAYGYASADYIQYVYGTWPLKVSTSYGSLNVRSGPGTSHGIIGKIARGHIVIALSEANGWYRIVFNGSNVGYVSGLYLTSVMAWPIPVSQKINEYFSAGTHNGLDIGSAVRGVAGDAVISAQSGTVVYAGWLSGYGNVVYINSVYNGQPIQTRYGHLASPPDAHAGDPVGIGQRIGYMGSTGTSSGVHLHFEVRIRHNWTDCIANADSTPVDPMNYL